MQEYYKIQGNKQAMYRNLGLQAITGHIREMLHPKNDKLSNPLDPIKMTESLSFAKKSKNMQIMFGVKLVN